MLLLLAGEFLGVLSVLLGARKTGTASCLLVGLLRRPAGDGTVVNDGRGQGVGYQVKGALTAWHGVSDGEGRGLRGEVGRLDAKLC